MPMSFTGLAAPAAALFNYNRANFLYDRGQKVQREYTGLSMRMQQFGLYRQDIRDVAGLTTARMNNYHVVTCLELGMCVTLLGPARMPKEVPEWVVWQQLVSLCGAFAYLVASLWLATLAAVCAESLNVRLQTQYIRLPVPDSEQLDEALTQANEFETENVGSMLRLPFFQQVKKALNGQNVIEGANADVAATGVKDTSSGSHWKSSMDGGGRDGAGVRVDVEASRHPPSVAAEGPAVSLEHLKLYRELQRNWQGLDAYARVCMSVGTHWLFIALGHYMVGWTVCYVGKLLPAIGATLAFIATAQLLVYLDLVMGHWEFACLAILIALGPALVCLGAATHPTSDYGVPWPAPCAGLVQALLTVYFWYVGRSAPGEKAMPFRFRGVRYLDVFGPIISELQNGSMGDARAWWLQESDARGRDAARQLELALSEWSGTLANRRDVLQAAVQFAGAVGVPCDMRCFIAARRELAGLDALREVQRLRRTMRRWAQGDLQRHLRSADHAELARMAEVLEVLAAKLNQSFAGRAHESKSSGLPPKGASQLTSASAPSDPAWIPLEYNMGGFGHEEDYYEYYAGEDDNGQATYRWQLPPGAVRLESLRGMQARLAALTRQSHELLRAARKEGDSSGETKHQQGGAQSADAQPPGWAPITPLVRHATSRNATTYKKQVLQDDGVDAENPTSTVMPVRTYQALSAMYALLWLCGVCYHAAEVVEGPKAVERRLGSLVGSGKQLFAPGEDATHAAAVLQSAITPLRRPEPFFKPRSFMILPEERNIGYKHLLLSNGYLLYRYSIRPDDNGSAAVSGEPARMECGAAIHDSFFPWAQLAGEGADAAPALAIAVGRSLWGCRAVKGDRAAEIVHASAPKELPKPLATLPDQTALEAVGMLPAMSLSFGDASLWAAMPSKEAEHGPDVFFVATNCRPRILVVRRNGPALAGTDSLERPPGGSRLSWQALFVVADQILVGVADDVTAWCRDTGNSLVAAEEEVDAEMSSSEQDAFFEEFDTEAMLTAGDGLEAVSSGPRVLAWRLSDGRMLGSWSLPPVPQIQTGRRRAAEWVAWGTCPDGRRLCGLAETAAGAGRDPVSELLVVLLPEFDKLIDDACARSALGNSTEAVRESVPGDRFET
eukprot:TRINITY_DN22079_c0_g1_i1.p1 TRINITY_DN22079_c0_g1~~TRINITY_DN22079_c0_g1_i1.p1  ORF type:complete len:1126 (+),score=187.13 TRINITY_DN22079_c0_g1_i1:79-3456(+)